MASTSDAQMKREAELKIEKLEADIKAEKDRARADLIRANAYKESVDNADERKLPDGSIKFIQDITGNRTALIRKGGEWWTSYPNPATGKMEPGRPYDENGGTPAVKKPDEGVKEITDPSGVKRKVGEKFAYGRGVYYYDAEGRLHETSSR